MSVTCHRVADNLNLYHPYTDEYRRPGSTLYKDFCPHDPLEIGSYAKVATALDWQGDRDSLAEAVVNYLWDLGAPQQARDNAALLRQPNSVCVVTGHQPGLFGGPLFLLFKWVSVLSLCRKLNELDDGYNYIPVYWNGSEDHNRGEFGRATVLDQGHDLIHLALPEYNRPLMAARTDAQEAECLLGELSRVLPDTEFHSELFDVLRSSLAGSLGTAMSHLAMNWFGRDGLVVVEPGIFRNMGKEVIKSALTGYQEIHDALATGREDMEDAGYPPPLMLHEAERTLVYHIDEHGERARLRVSANGGYSLEKRDMTFSGEEIFAEIDNHPKHFSPSAALRPIVQGAVMPVVAYVAGGGELAYHRQLRRLFSHFNVSMPLMVPRAAGTILKSNLLKAADKFDLELTGLISPGWDWDSVSEKAEEQGSKRVRAFSQAEENLRENFAELAEGLRSAGFTNMNEVERECDKICGRLEGLAKRFENQDPLVGEGPKRQYWRLRKFILPGESYQELSVWTIYFVNMFGPTILRDILEEIAPLSPEHHLFVVE